MLSNKGIKYLKDNGYSFEEIEGIKKGINQVSEGKLISNDEMKNFVGSELFSKYTSNV